MANEKIPGLGFHHIGLMASDFEKSCAFYSALGMKELVSWGEGNEKIAMFDLGNGDRVELFASGGDDYSAKGKFIHFAMTVEDVDAAFETALAAGARPKMPPTTLDLDSSPYRMSIRIAFVYGPDGEELEFFKQVK